MKRKIKDVIVSLSGWISTILLLLSFYPVLVSLWLILFHFRHVRFKLIHGFACIWAWLIVFFNPYWKVKVINKEKLIRNRPCVFISNHQSMVDILLLFLLFIPFRFVAKIELFRIPFLGWGMSMASYIPVDRKNRNSFPAMYHACETSLKEGVPVMIFPEGTRTMSGQLNSFKEGAFRIAIHNKVPIQPIVIKGSYEALPGKGLILNGPQYITIKILDEIPYEQFPSYESRELSLWFHSLYEKEFS